MLNERERAADALNYLDAGCGADEHFKIACGAAAAGLDFEQFNNWSASASPDKYKGESDCRSTWKSASKPGAVTAATLFGMARAQGWRDETRTKDERPAPTYCQA